MLKLLLLSILSTTLAAPAPGLLDGAAVLAAPAVHVAPGPTISSSSSSVVHSTALVQAAAPVVAPAVIPALAPALHGGLLAAPAVAAAPTLLAPGLTHGVAALPAIAGHGLLGAPVALGVHGIH